MYNRIVLPYPWQKDYSQYLIEKGLKPKWAKEYRRTLYRFGQYLNRIKVTDLNKITRQDLLGFQEYIYKTYQITKPTMRMKVVVLRGLFQYLYYKKLIATNPANKLELLDPPIPVFKKQRRYYSWEELKRFWTTYLRSARYTWLSIKQRLFNLEQFINYLKVNSIKTLYKIQSKHINDYENYLKNYEIPLGGHYKEYCIAIKLRHIEKFFKILYYHGIIKDIPTKELDFTKYNKFLLAKKREEEKKLVEKDSNPVATKLELLAEKFLSWRSSQGFRRDCRPELRRFLRYLIMHGIVDFSLVTKQDILNYQDYLHKFRTPKGKPYSLNTTQNLIGPLFSLFRFLAVYDFITKDPTAGLAFPKGETGLPRTLMKPNEVKRLLNAPDILTTIGIRDRTIMEVLYSTGMRADELANLQPEDVDFGRGIIKVTHPKGGPEFGRVVPIGVIACDWIKKYLSESRPLLNLKKEPYLFLSKSGHKLDPGAVNRIVKGYCFSMGLRKSITSHSFRVTCATLMLENEADVRFVQEQLGHRSIISTQVYTRLVPKSLKRVHEKCHPREREARGLEPVIPTDSKKELPEEKKDDILKVSEAIG